MSHSSSMARATFNIYGIPVLHRSRSRSTLSTRRIHLLQASLTSLSTLLDWIIRSMRIGSVTVAQRRQCTVPFDFLVLIPPIRSQQAEMKGALRKGDRADLNIYTVECVPCSLLSSQLTDASQFHWKLGRPAWLCDVSSVVRRRPFRRRNRHSLLNRPRWVHCRLQHRQDGRP